MTLRFTPRFLAMILMHVALIGVVAGDAIVYGTTSPLLDTYLSLVNLYGINLLLRAQIARRRHEREDREDRGT